MRVPVCHSLALTAALCLTAAAPDDGSRAPVWAGASVSEKLRIIRQSVGAREPRPADEQPVLAQRWRNCISGYWRNC